VCLIFLYCQSGAFGALNDVESDFELVFRNVTFG
jgi:hypothetical protein